MAVNVAYDQVQWVEIGYNAANHIEIDNVISWADRVVSPDGDMVYPMQFINLYSPPGVHHNHKYWEMEMTLDSNYLETTASPLQYWPYYLDVQVAALNQYPIVCDAANNYIEWLKVYVRESDGTQTCLTYADEDDNVVWVTSEVSSFSNEIGERHQPVTWRFICLQERAKTYTALTHTPGVNESPIKVMRIDNFTVGGNVCTNVLRFEDEFFMQMTPQFIPNTFQGLDLKQDQHWRLLTLVVDSETDILDTYIDITTANTPLPINFSADFTLADGLGTTETWTYAGAANESYVISRRDGEIHSDVPRDTIEYRIITVCNKTITQS